MKRLAVFCGSSTGAHEAYKEGAIQLGKEFANQNIALVYGGSSVGMMGTIADAVLENGGKVIGVMPTLLEKKEASHAHLTEMIVVDSMHERKAKMAELSDGFIALPGGLGTLEEFVEVFTWAQLGIHQKPCGLLNIRQYYDPLVNLFIHMVNQQFMNEKYQTMVLVDDSPKALMEKFHRYEPPLST